MAKVTKVSLYSIYFDNGFILTSEHKTDCCESHYLSMEHLSLDDFEGLEFDLSNENFFTEIPGYGIALNPVLGHPIRIPGYGFNNGYYSSDLDLVLIKDDKVQKRYFISECQVIQ